MSLVALLDPTKELRDQLKQQELMAESMARIGAMFGLTTDELNDALFAAIHKKRLQHTQGQCDKMFAKHIQL